MPDSRRLPGEIASEQLTQANVHMRDMITTRCQPGTAYDEDNGLPVSIALSSPVGSCTTAGGTVAKVVNITNFADFELQPGIEISVYFSNKNTANNPTLNVAGTGAIPICLAGQASSVSLGEGCILPGIYQFKYIDVTVGGTRHQNWLLLNSDIAARGTDYTIYADGTSVYPTTVVDNKLSNKATIAYQGAFNTSIELQLGGSGEGHSAYLLSMATHTSSQDNEMLVYIIQMGYSGQYYMYQKIMHLRTINGVESAIHQLDFYKYNNGILGLTSSGNVTVNYKLLKII